jgi:hypothetical protein
MLRFSTGALAVALAWPAAALSQAGPPPTAPMDLHTQPPAMECVPTGADHEVIVCGNRQRSPYRPDEAVVDAERSKEAGSNPARVQDRSGNPDLCGTVRNECSGGTIPLLEPALRVATAIVDAAEGDDWRQAFRNGPSDYDRYRDAKPKRGKISIGITAGNSGHR